MSPTNPGMAQRVPVLDRAFAVFMTMLMVLATFLTFAATPATVSAAEGENCGVYPVDLVIVIDRSGSMNTDTIPGAGTKSRLAWAQEAANGLVAQFDANGGVGGSGIHRIGISSFGGTTASRNVALADALGASAITPAVNAIVANGGTPLDVGMAEGASNMLGRRPRHPPRGPGHAAHHLPVGRQPRSGQLYPEQRRDDCLPQLGRPGVLGGHRA